MKTKLSSYYTMSYFQFAAKNNVNLAFLLIYVKSICSGTIFEYRDMYKLSYI